MIGVTQPSGTVTLVFTDIEGSTRLLDELGVAAYREALAEHRRVVREACARHEGYEVDYEGDAFFYAFASAQAAVSAVSEAMHGLDGGPIRIRVGIHTGEPALDPPKYVGMDVHRAARIMAVSHGGQVVLSPTTVALLDPGSFRLEALGRHRLKDLTAPIPLHQLRIGGLPDEFPPLKTLYRTNLPVPATPFLGREAELREVVARLIDPDTRLLTLTGPGGTGKTRLALQAAAQAADSFPDGVYWVPLAPLRDAALVVPTIAQALGVGERSGEELGATLVAGLQGKTSVLVLDNAEHLLPEAVEHVVPLLDGCPSLTVLVTSRERLQLGHETAWPVPPLSEPDGESLFYARAHAAGVTLPPSSVVGELCRRLDELPLALELAAARTVVFSPAQLLDRLGQRLDLLKAGRAADPRQQTLRHTIDWSYRLLDAEEQRVYRALSMFAGGCTLDAAETVAAADPDSLQSLIDKSLLRRRAADHGPRYWLLETIREHAADALRSAGEDERVFERFLVWVTGLVGDVDEYWADRDQLEWFDTLETERENLMRCLIECHRRGGTEDEARLVLAAFEFFDTRGPWAPVADLIGNMRPTEDRLRARASYARAFLLHRSGHVRDARLECDAALAVASELGDDSITARALSMRAAWTVMVGEGTAESQLPAADEAVALARRSDDQYALGHALNCLGIVTSTFDPAASHELHLEAAGAALDVGDQRNAALFGCNIVTANLALRRATEAADRAQQIIPILHRLGDRHVEAIAVMLLAQAYVASGDGDAAREAAARAVELFGGWQDEFDAVMTVFVLALASASRDPREAIVLWGAAEGARTRLSLPLTPEFGPYMDVILEPLRTVEGFEDLWQVGTELELDEAIDRGLGRR